jgi:hypothetical protein
MNKLSDKNLSELQSWCADYKSSNMAGVSPEVVTQLLDHITAQAEEIKALKGNAFHQGARSMFDNVMFAAANNWHGNPEQNEGREATNKAAIELITDAFENVSPEQYVAWKSLDAALSELSAIKGRLTEDGLAKCLYRTLFHPNDVAKGTDLIFWQDGTWPEDRAKSISQAKAIISHVLGEQT